MRIFDNPSSDQSLTYYGTDDAHLLVVHAALDLIVVLLAVWIFLCL